MAIGAKVRQALALPLEAAAGAVDQIPPEFRGGVAATAGGSFLQARDGLVRRSDDFANLVAPPAAPADDAADAAKARPAAAPRAIGSTATGAGAPVGRSAPAPRAAGQAPRPRPRNETASGNAAPLGPLPNLVPTRLPAAGATGALPKPPLASALGSFLALDAAQRRARNAPGSFDDAIGIGGIDADGDFDIEGNETPLSGDTELGDSSVPDASGRSPLDLDAEGPRSYTDAQRPDAGNPFPGAEDAADIFEGGGHVVGPDEEAQRAAELSRRQQQARENFIPEQPGRASTGAANSGRPSETASVGSIPRRLDSQGPAAPLPGGSEQSAARQMMQRLAQERRKGADQIRKGLRQMAEQAFRRKAVQSTRIAIEAAQAVTGPIDGGTTIATLAVQMNVQLLSTYVLRGLLGMPSSNPEASADLAMLAADTFIPKQTFPETVFTIWFDCAIITFVPISCTVLLIALLFPFVAPALAIFSFLPVGQ